MVNLIVQNLVELLLIRNSVTMLAVLGEHVMNLILLCYVALIVQFFKKFLTLGWFFGVHFAELAYGPFGFFSILQELVL